VGLRGPRPALGAAGGVLEGVQKSGIDVAHSNVGTTVSALACVCLARSPINPTVWQIFGDHGRPRPVPTAPVTAAACGTCGPVHAGKCNVAGTTAGSDGSSDLRRGGLRIPGTRRPVRGVPVLPKSVPNHPHESPKTRFLFERAPMNESDPHRITTFDHSWKRGF